MVGLLIVITNKQSAPEYKEVLHKWGFKDKYPAMIISSHLAVFIFFFNATLQFLKIFFSSSQREVFTYSKQEEIQAEQITEFCNDFLSGKLKPHTIKQTKAEKSKNVKTLIHDNYQKIVHDNTKDVVVYFYLPPDQCAHCDKFLSDFEFVAEKLANTDNLVFAKLDVSANSQIPGLHVHNFPTIRVKISFLISDFIFFNAVCWLVKII